MWTLVGIDCATQEERVGLARAVLDDGGSLRVERVTLGTAGESVEGTVAGWLRGSNKHLVALNAPLGFPARLGPALTAHGAGGMLVASGAVKASDPDTVADLLLRRETERVVQARTGRAPVETTADRLARRAVAGLAFLQRLRAASHAPLPLAWHPGTDSGILEVRADATLRAHGVRTAAYRGGSHKARHARESIVGDLASRMELRVSSHLLTQNSDLLDALVCTLAAADFARGRCIVPADMALAKQEGWIWFRGDGQIAMF